MRISVSQLRRIIKEEVQGLEPEDGDYELEGDEEISDVEDTVWRVVMPDLRRLCWEAGLLFTDDGYNQVGFAIVDGVGKDPKSWDDHEFISRDG